MHTHGERAQGRLQVTVHVAHEARVAVARGDHHTPGQHRGKNDREADARAEQFGVTHCVRISGALHRKRNCAGIHEQCADDQHERERRVALQHVLLTHPNQYERRYARSTYGADGSHGQRGRYPHVLLPRHWYQTVLTRHRSRCWPPLARRTRRVRPALGQMQFDAAVQTQATCAIRVLYVSANRFASATVLGHVH